MKDIGGMRIMKRSFSIRKMKLASKTASVIGIVVTTVLVLQSLISIHSASGAVSTAISGEFKNNEGFL